jgi:GNAT superfamily N-acetyltransferase
MVLNAWLENKNPETVASWFASSGNVAIVAVTGHAIVGLALLTRLGKISLFYVDPNQRKSGVGKTLLAHIEACAAELELDSLQIDSTISATAFYLRHGFMYVGTKKTRFGITSIRLRKLLGTTGKPGHSKPICRCAPEHATEPYSG